MLFKLISSRSVYLKYGLRLPNIATAIKFQRQSSLIRNKFHRYHQNDNTNHRNLLLYAAAPTFLAFFNKEEEDDDTGKSLLEKVIGKEIIRMFKKEEIDESPEGQLIMTIKRTILCIHRKEYKKAEQMGHLALRMAQDLQNYHGVTLCFDVMANLALECEQYEKAAKLFVAVLQRLLQQGAPLDDSQVLHIGLKMANIAELQEKWDEAKTGYIWTISKLDAKRKTKPDDSDVYELWGLANNYYGKFLLQRGQFAEAKDRLKESYDIFLQTRGRNEPEFIDILNDLAVACTHTNDLTAAEVYMEDALRLAVVYPDMLETGIYHANRGLIYLRKGLLSEATKLCNHAKKISNKSNSPDGIEQTNYCLEQIKEFCKERNVNSNS